MELLQESVCSCSIGINISLLGVFLVTVATRIISFMSQRLSSMEQGNKIGTMMTRR